MSITTYFQNRQILPNVVAVWICPSTKPKISLFLHINHVNCSDDHILETFKAIGRNEEKPGIEKDESELEIPDRAITVKKLLEE